MFVCTPKMMKKAEAAAVSRGSSYLELMENAGKAAARVIAERMLRCRRVLILCGKGNNGGDGFVIARELSRLYDDAVVTVLLMCGEPSSDIALTELERIRNSGVNIVSLDDHELGEDYDAVVDAVFGTGFHGELDGRISDFMAKINRMNCLRAAVDIPSGANSEDGNAAENTFAAHFTVTFGANKLGMLMGKAKKACGEVVVCDIGINDDDLLSAEALTLADTDLVSKLIPIRPENAHKGMFGKLLITAGCESMSGAAAMNVKAALRSGAGLVRLASVEKVIDRTAAHIYEATYVKLKSDHNGCISAESIPDVLSALEKSTCGAVGSGLSHTPDTERLVKEIIAFCGEKNIPLIIDADGLNCIADSIELIRNAKCRAVLTPHPGELARLLGISTDEVTADRLGAAKRLAEKTNAVVAAKGYPTYISCGRRTYVSFTGNPGLSRGGSGDVLTGIISGLCASGLSPEDAALCGVYIFGLAADMTARKLSLTGMLPSDVIETLPFAFGIMDR
ncbi:MAG: NAD(P)H-hydrate dehydratase [Huintestinicola sp.]